MELREVEERAVNCKKCELWETRQNVIVGEGSLNAKIMFIGEAPGFNEDKQGKPFVGRAGKVLDGLLKEAGLKREEIYITNILKCRPPENRNPSEEEIKSCTPYLNEQIEIINPKIICCLGNFAANFVMKKFNLSNQFQGISSIHGKVFNISTLTGKIKVIPFFHPAVVTYNPNKLNILKKDFEVLKKEMVKV